MRFTRFFQVMRQRPDRAVIRLEWIERVIERPEKELVQEDGRIRALGAGGGDGRRRAACYTVTGSVHNAFFDRAVRL